MRPFKKFHNFKKEQFDENHVGGKLYTPPHAYVNRTKPFSKPNQNHSCFCDYSRFFVCILFWSTSHIFVIYYLYIPNYERKVFLRCKFLNHLETIKMLACHNTKFICSLRTKYCWFEQILNILTLMNNWNIRWLNYQSENLRFWLIFSIKLFSIHYSESFPKTYLFSIWEADYIPSGLNADGLNAEVHE